ncbi:hypothetical protein ALC53_01866 [Atta colombica]|uniref:Uncharacterized protein n=1 Tax=Atta colombica TaxID=520822 RepID=A0A151I5H6_9HYME|nr:hypothetical protein ALC53_01866 [Atta colombica]
MIMMNSHISQISRELNMFPATVCRIVHVNHIHLYHITLNQELSNNDKILRHILQVGV